MSDEYDWSALSGPFHPDEIEWRVAQAGKGKNGIWAKVLAYMTSRAVQDRLDRVIGAANWCTDYRVIGNTLAAGIGIRIGDEWVWKWDGAGHLAATAGLGTEDAGKGDYSNAQKRAAVQWGIGRYLYRLPEAWANVHPDGANYARLPKDKGGDPFNWDPPALPGWALPADAAPEAVEKKAPTNGARRAQSKPAALTGDAIHCPACSGPMWDNRTDEKAAINGGKRPDLKCKDKECDTAIWMGSVRDDLKASLEQATQADILTDAERVRVAGVIENYKEQPAGLLAALDWIREKMMSAQEAA